MTFLINDKSVNSYGYVVSTKGIVLSEFLKNPVMLYGHDTNNVIGTWTNLQVKGSKLLADPVFDEDDDFAMKIKRKVDKDIIKSASLTISFRKEDLKLIDGEITVTKSVLKEISIVSIPANKNAVKLMLMDDNEELSENDIKLLIDETITKNNDSKMNKEILLKLGLNNEDEIMDKLQSLVETEAKHAELTNTIKDIQNSLNEKEAEVAELNEKLETIEKEKKQKEIDGFISKAIEDKKINENQKESFLKLAETAFDEVQKIINEIKPMTTETQTSLSEMVQTGGGNDNRDEWTLDEWNERDPDGLQEMVENDPVRFDRIYKNTIKE